ncbi:MAG: phosphatidate cytidylyltransferase, partial [Nitrospirota bacterium]|nr:phosphatidate cytidylyltransferase [Nitrospirota bacterium]
IPQLTVSLALIIGVIIGIISIIGDLVESMFKRDAGVKDSSSLIPGHGGILDKMDGALFAGPVLYWMLIVIGMIEK